jgi:uncharacterized protein DUF4383
MQNQEPARLYALVVGLVLVLAGIVGFFYESSFTSDSSVRDGVLGMLDVNGWHNVVHIATGALGLVAFASGVSAARTYAFAIGAVYVIVAVWGFAIGDGQSILGIIPINTEDSVLHLLIGLTGIGAGVASQSARVSPAAAH